MTDIHEDIKMKNQPVRSFKTAFNTELHAEIKETTNCYRRNNAATTPAIINSIL